MENKKYCPSRCCLNHISNKAGKSGNLCGRVTLLTCPSKCQRWICRNNICLVVDLCVISPLPCLARGRMQRGGHGACSATRYIISSHQLSCNFVYWCSMIKREPTENQCHVSLQQLCALSWACNQKGACSLTLFQISFVVTPKFTIHGGFQNYDRPCLEWCTTVRPLVPRGPRRFVPVCPAWKCDRLSS